MFKLLGYLFFACILFSCKKQEIPIVITSLVKDIKGNTAVCGGTIIDIGGDTIISKGVCWSTTKEPTIDDIKSSETTPELQFTSNLGGLSAGYKYHIRAYATNALGTGYGEVRTFETPVMDVNGNVYDTVVIGTQTWMAENLKVTSYDVDIPLLNITDKNIWSYTLFQAYCWYNNDSTNFKKVYGALYNWYAVNSRSLCPFGWHIPTDSEWDDLINYLGGPSVAGGKLKESGTIHWLSPNTGATDQVGFNAQPSGERNNVGDFIKMGNLGIWWCDSYTPGSGYAYEISYDKASVIKYLDVKNSGFAVRCIKNK